MRTTFLSSCCHALNKLIVKQLIIVNLNKTVEVKIARKTCHL